MNILLILIVAVTVGAVVFGVMTLVTGGDPGLRPVEPDSRARPLPDSRPLAEGDIGRVTFDVAFRGYRMDQVDSTLRRVAYDIGYKSELIDVLDAEIVALREGRREDADAMARARAAALAPRVSAVEPEREPEPKAELVSEVAAEEPDFEIDLETDTATDATVVAESDVSKSTS